MGVKAKRAWGPLCFLGSEVRLSRLTSTVLATALQTRLGTHDTDVNAQIHRRPHTCTQSGLGAAVSGDSCPSSRHPFHSINTLWHRGAGSPPREEKLCKTPYCCSPQSWGPSTSWQEVPWPPVPPKIAMSAEQALLSSPRGPAPSQQNSGGRVPMGGLY